VAVAATAGGGLCRNLTVLARCSMRTALF